MKHKLDIVIVNWIDARSSDPWQSEAEAELKWKTPARVTTVGALVERTKELVIICQSFGHGDVTAWLSIPRGWVKGVKKIGTLDLGWCRED